MILVGMAVLSIKHFLNPSIYVFIYLLYLPWLFNKSLSYSKNTQNSMEKK